MCHRNPAHQTAEVMRRRAETESRAAHLPDGPISPVYTYRSVNRFPMDKEAGAMSKASPTCRSRRRWWRLSRRALGDAGGAVACGLFWLRSRTRTGRQAFVERCADRGTMSGILCPDRRGSTVRWTCCRIWVGGSGSILPNVPARASRAGRGGAGTAGAAALAAESYRRAHRRRPPPSMKRCGAGAQPARRVAAMHKAATQARAVHPRAMGGAVPAGPRLRGADGEA